MNDAIKHRGPDAEGHIVLNNSFALGHRRLSIIDLDARSNQPMVSPAGNVLVYNGEIYNYKEIKEQIHDYHFQTESDTEVILATIECYGLDWLLKRANGMFAFAYFDAAPKRVYLVRDRLGIKPLYYYQSDRLLVFSSEIKGILSSGLIDAEFNDAAIDEYLGNRYVRAPYTFFTGVYSLEPGRYLEADVSEENRIFYDSNCYWKLPDEFNVEENFSEESVMREFEEQAIRAIRMRMVSDVNLGTYLSGGVDSSLITAIVSSYSSGSVNTYTIGFPENNEFSFAQMVSKQYGTCHHEIQMDQNDYFQRTQKIIGYKDAPLAVPNEIPLALMSEVLKKDITVVLSGEGADELMGGYGRIFRSPYDYVNLKIYQQKKSFYDYFVEQYEYVPRWIRDKYLLTGMGIRSEKDALLSSQFSTKRNEENVFRFFHENHVQGLLQRVDTTTMLAGVEARVPFLDHKLIEFTYRKVPYDLKLHWKQRTYSGNTIDAASVYSEEKDIPKYLLRKVAEKYLPKQLVYRKKVGFPVPLNAWIDDLHLMATNVLGHADWLRSDMIGQLLQDAGNQSRAGQILWMFINVELFRKMFFSKNWKY